MRLLATAAIAVSALGYSLASAQNICAPLDPADVGKPSIQIPVPCEEYDTDCFESCVTWFDSPNQCTASIGQFDGSQAIWVWDILQAQTHKTGQDTTSKFRSWLGRFANGTTSLPDPDPNWPGLEIYLAWDYGLGAFVYDIEPRSPFVPQRIQFSIRFEEGGDVKGIFVDADC